MRLELSLPSGIEQAHQFVGNHLQGDPGLGQHRLGDLRHLLALRIGRHQHGEGEIRQSRLFQLRLRGRHVPRRHGA